jgi:hypothetical protein
MVVTTEIHFEWNGYIAGRECREICQKGNLNNLRKL